MRHVLGIALLAVAAGAIFVACGDNPAAIEAPPDVRLVTDTVVVTDTVIVTDTVVVTDTVEVIADFPVVQVMYRDTLVVEREARPSPDYKALVPFFLTVRADARAFITEWIEDARLQSSVYSGDDLRRGSCEVFGEPRFCLQAHQYFADYGTRTVQFTAVLPDGVATAELTISVRPPDDDGHPITETTTGRHQ